MGFEGADRVDLLLDEELELGRSERTRLGEWRKTISQIGAVVEA
jgi:hypothetical protein